jgi:hypothetical protein
MFAKEDFIINGCSWYVVNQLRGVGYVYFEAINN